MPDVDIPAAWTGPSGHVLHQLWMPGIVRARITDLISTLEHAAPEGLARCREHFRNQGQVANRRSKRSPEHQLEQAMSAVLELRAELLVGAKLVQAGVLRRIRADTPDFECVLDGQTFGVEVTTRARDDVVGALHNCLERKLHAGPDVLVTLRRNPVVFALNPDQVDEISNEIVAAARSGTVRSVAYPDAGVAAMILPSAGCLPGARVVFDMPHQDPEWDQYWTNAARQIVSRTEDKGRKNYDIPSVAVVDISRLGWAGRLPIGPWAAKFQQALDSCALGNLTGTVLIRSALTSHNVELLALRGGKTAATVAALLLTAER